MGYSDFHVHTFFSDGKSSPEEMILSAISRGMDRIGFSDHSYTDFDVSYCMKKERLSEYRSVIRELKKKYEGKIEVFCGIEQDLFGGEGIESYDYAIGSVHYIKTKDSYIPVDESPEILIRAAKKYFGGDMLKLTAAYYEQTAQVIEKTGADIIGHFDLIAKFNENNRLFDETSDGYLEPAKKAADCLMKSGRVFEINTGAISRGYRTSAYPSEPLMSYIIEKGGSFILSSDSHSTENICFGFSEYEKLYTNSIVEFK